MRAPRPAPRRRPLATSLVVAALTASACSSGGGGSPAQPKAATETTIPSFTYAITQLPTSLNGMTTKTDTAQISSLVTETLEHATARDGVPQLSPNLAESVTQPDNKTIVYRLRDAKFSDGTALTPEDVIWSIEATAAPTAETAGNMAGFASASATGPHEVTVKWKYGDPNMRLGVSGAVQVQKAAFAKQHSSDLGTPSALPIGTGPYKYQAQTSQAIDLVANPQYWGARPKAGSLKFTVIADDSSARLALQSGSIQGAEVKDVKTSNQWQAISGTSLHTSPGLSSNVLSLDTSKAPFDDIHVRNAVAYSVDTGNLGKAAYGDYADTLTTVVPVESIASVAPSLDEAKKFLDQLPKRTFDLGKAKQELAASAHAGGFTAEVPYRTTDPADKLLVLSLQENMKSLGVTIVPKPVQPAEWAQEVFSHTATGIQVLTGLTIIIPDPSGMLYYFVGKENMVPNSLNLANFTTPAIEQALPMISPAGSGGYTKDQRWNATKTIITELAQQAPYVPLYSSKNVYALKDGYTFTEPPGTLDLLTGAWIDYLRSTK
ncbi:ABC transporter substrate-binding protein [Amycolatopsis sp. NPDC098790]|uniref:ABC transporter substrate-binding protein n=1 Tax=Amycolatopsis sp. NPDC098790 TaxID=3363939 RepID=UPI0038278E11